MNDQTFEIQPEPTRQSQTAQELQTQKAILDQIFALPLTPNQRNFAKSKVSYALFDFPDNQRAAFLLAKKNCYSLTPDEARELEPYCFFPEEHPNLRKFIRDRKTIAIGDNNIEVVNRNPDPEVVLDDEHMRVIEETLKRVVTRAPQIAQRLHKIFLIKKKDTEKEEYGPNGECTKRQCDDVPTGIVLTQQGYRYDIPHRIAGVNNLQGTIAHELGHMLGYLYPDFVNKFRESLGYHSIRAIDWGSKKVTITEDGWERIVQNNYEVFVHKPSGKKTYTGTVPRDMDLLPTHYACLYPIEDIAESFVAWVFDRHLDETRKGLFNELFIDDSSNSN